MDYIDVPNIVKKNINVYGFKKQGVVCVQHAKSINMTHNTSHGYDFIFDDDHVATTAGKLGIPPPPKLTTFELPLVEKRRKRKAEVLHEVFAKENIMVDGMQRNLSLPEEVIGKVGLVIKEPEARIFLYNGLFDLVFQRRNEYHLASTTQLIRIQNLINVDSKYAQQVYDVLIYKIQSRPDFVQAKKIIAKNLDGID
ncbi:hypothetical protein Tco_0613311 [Tanacetum coccineum]